MSDAYNDLAGRVSAFLGQARTVSADGLTWGEFGELTVGLLTLTTKTLDTVSTLTGPAKKDLCLEAVAVLFDQVADRCVPLYLLPIWWMARPAIRSLVIALAAGAVEKILPLVRG